MLTYLEYLAVLLSLLSVYWCIQQNPKTWIAGIFAVAAYAYLFFHVHLYADFGLQLLFLLLQCYGFLAWIRSSHMDPANESALLLKIYSVMASERCCFLFAWPSKSFKTKRNRLPRAKNALAVTPFNTRGDGKKIAAIQSSQSASLRGGPKPDEAIQSLPVLHISSCPKTYYLWLILFSVCTTWLLAYTLQQYTTPRFVWLDAGNAVVCVVALWMQAKKYLESWILWFGTNAVYVGMYYQTKLYPSALLYTLFLALAFVGYKKWKAIAESTRS